MRVGHLELVDVIDRVQDRLFDGAGLVGVVAEDDLRPQRALDHHAADIDPHRGDVVVRDHLKRQLHLLELDLELLVAVQEVLLGRVAPGVRADLHHDRDVIDPLVVPDAADVLLPPLDLVHH